MSQWWRRWLSAGPAPQVPGPWAAYGERARAAGVDRLYLLLTFDCDTDLDIAAAPQLARELGSRGIKAGYAVPGAQLRKSPEVWRGIAGGGSEFLNHGDRAHAEFRDGRYWPMTFYEKLSEAEVVADIEAGDRAVREVTGTAATGFRAPHFGSFQEPDQLDLLYRTVRRLGYRYCSTTTPALALSRGPVVKMNDIVELPTLGSYRHPTTLLDSWTYLTDRVNYTLGDTYAELFVETIQQMSRENIPGILTYYGDPSHVTGMKPFATVLDAIVRHGIPSLHGREAIDRFVAV
jgi:peptidoglycan/xylan/chitin deacetylase (PgdA/CDA1 family)